MDFETFLFESTEVKLADFRHFKDLKGTVDFKKTAHGTDAKKNVQGFWILWHDTNEDDYNVSHVEIIKDKSQLLLHKVSPTPEFSGDKAETVKAFAKMK